MRTLLWCGAMNVVWLGGMAYLALDNAANFDPRALIGTAVAWLLATAASWLLFRGATGAQWWQLAVWTFLVSIVALVFVTISAAFVAPPCRSDRIWAFTWSGGPRCTYTGRTGSAWPSRASGTRRSSCST